VRKLVLGVVLLAGLISVQTLEGGLLPAKACRFIQYYQALDSPQTEEMNLWERAMLSFTMLRKSPANRS